MHLQESIPYIDTNAKYHYTWNFAAESLVNTKWRSEQTEYRENPNFFLQKHDWV